MRHFLFILLLLAASPGFAESPGFEKEEAASEAELQALDIAEHAKLMADLEDKAKVRTQERKKKLEKAMAEKSQKLEVFNQLPESEKETRIQQAKKWANQSKKAYDRNRYKSAESSIKRAIQLDPSNDLNYFMYGVSLYRNQKYEEALINFELGKDDSDGIESSYYKGLIHLKLVEYWAAAENFKAVRKANRPVFSANAAFYEGVIDYTLQKYTEAQEAFEWVLDNSKDPALDRKADEYMENIAQAIQAKRYMAKKWSITASAGLNYDSNILFSPDNDAASAVVENEGGGRALLQGKLDRKLKRKKYSDFSAYLSSLYMYSFDSDFNRADPWLSSLGFNYNKRGETMRSKAYQYKFNPYGEILYMDANDDGTREKILTSAVLDNSLTIIQRKNYFAAYGVQLRIDNSYLDFTDEDENSDAFKYILTTTHTWFKGENQRKAMIAKIEYSANDAKGKNKNFNRIKAGITYVVPTKTRNVWTLGASVYKLSYPESDDDRRDTNVALDYSYTKVKNENWSYTGVASYASNVSTVDDSQYTRYSVMALANYSWSD